MAERCKLCGAPLDNDGRCVSVLCLRAQVARLEADNAAMEAALRDDCDCVIMWAGCRREGWTCLDEQRRAADPDAPYVAVWRERLISGAERCRGCRNSVALSDAGKGWLPPKVGEQDVEAAIYFMEQAKTTHEEWAAYVISGGELPEFVGDLKRHQEYIQEYEHTIAVLCAALDALKGAK